jgi:hypothetical protein
MKNEDMGGTCSTHAKDENSRFINTVIGKPEG